MKVYTKMEAIIEENDAFEMGILRNFRAFSGVFQRIFMKVRKGSVVGWKYPTRMW